MSDEPPVFPDMEGADRDGQPESQPAGFPPAPPVEVDPATAAEKAAARKYWWINFLCVFVPLALMGLSFNSLAFGYLGAFIMIIVSGIQNGVAKTAKGKRGSGARLAAAALAMPTLFMLCIGQLTGANSSGL